MFGRLIRALALSAGALALMPVQVQADAGHAGFGQYGWDGAWGWGHMLFGPLMMVLFWGAVILLIVLAVRWLGGGSSGGDATPTARKSAHDILQERFARGEIDREEFEQRERLLAG
jgi:putative membrane protein